MMISWAAKKKKLLLESVKGQDSKLEAALKKKALVIPGIL